MKNLVRFLGFSLALFLAVSATAQTNSGNWAPIGSKEAPTGSEISKEFISMYDFAVIDILNGTVDYQVFVKKDPNDAWMLVQSQSNVSGGDPNSDVGTSDADIYIEQPESYQLKVVLSMDCAECATLMFKY